MAGVESSDSKDRSRVTPVIVLKRQLQDDTGNLATGDEAFANTDLVMTELGYNTLLAAIERFKATYIRTYGITPRYPPTYATLERYFYRFVDDMKAMKPAVKIFDLNDTEEQ